MKGFFPYRTFIREYLDRVEDAFETPGTSFHAPVVKTIRTFDGLPDGIPLTESYRYAKGMVDGKGGITGFETVEVTHPDGHAKTQTKNALGRVAAVEEVSDGRTLTIRYDYNAVGEVLRMTDAQGNVTEMAYDKLGRKTALTDPHTGTWRYEYNDSGSLISQTDPMGRVIRYSHDALGRVIRKTADTETLARYTYDGAVSNGRGRLAAVSRGEVTDRIEGYDTMGRILKGTRTFAGPSGHPGKSYTTLSRYDVSGRLAELTYPGYRRQRASN